MDVSMSIGNLALGNSVAMEHFPGAERALCVSELYKNDNSATIVRRIFSNIRGFRHLNHAPRIPLNRNWVKKLKKTSSTLDKQNLGRLMLSITKEKVEWVNRFVRNEPDHTIRKCASVLNLHRSSLHFILHKDLKQAAPTAIIGPYFAEDGGGHALTMNSERYVKILDEFYCLNFRIFLAVFYVCRPKSPAQLKQMFATIWKPSRSIHHGNRNLGIRLNDCREREDRHLDDIIFMK